LGKRVERLVAVGLSRPFAPLVIDVGKALRTGAGDVGLEVAASTGPRRMFAASRVVAEGDRFVASVGIALRHGRNCSS